MPLINQVLRSIRYRFRLVWQIVLYYWHRTRLKQQLTPHSQEHAQYLETQLRRTLGKFDASLPLRSRRLIDKISDLVNLTQSDILCVGCRNSAEIDYFRSKGVKKAIGIDLYSNHENILVMDMHAMNFQDSCFDLIYSSHSLEHALYLERVIQEFVRVVTPGGVIAIEVPANFQTRGADLVDFKTVTNLLEKFAPYVSRVLCSGDYSILENGVKTEAIWTIFQVNK